MLYIYFKVICEDATDEEIVITYTTRVHIGAVKYYHACIDYVCEN